MVVVELVRSHLVVDGYQGAMLAPSESKGNNDCGWFLIGILPARPDSPAAGPRSTRCGPCADASALSLRILREQATMSSSLLLCGGAVHLRRLLRVKA